MSTILVLQKEIKSSRKTYGIDRTAVNEAIVDLGTGRRTEAVAVVRSVADSKESKFFNLGFFGLSVSSFGIEPESERSVAENASYCRRNISSTSYKA